jgi:hypothetical protein
MADGADALLSTLADDLAYHASWKRSARLARLALTARDLARATHTLAADLWVWTCEEAVQP